MTALVAGLATFVGMNGVRTARARARRQAATALSRDTIMVSHGLVQGSVRRALVPAGSHQAMSPREMRRRVASLAGGTYIGDVLAAQDSALYRWPDHFGDPLRVYVEPSSIVAGFDPAYPQVARDIFAEWVQAGFPLHFTFIFDSTSADLAIRWRERFGAEDGQRIGLTERVQTSDFQIAKATVDIATHDSSGRVFSAVMVAGILRHEIGHALGLNHAGDPSSVMYRESATSTIGASDRATLRLLYLVPGGSLKD
ncbi:MAG: matrixin family metalloprotease [bacterium]